MHKDSTYSFMITNEQEVKSKLGINFMPLSYSLETREQLLKLNSNLHINSCDMICILS
jgi:hypothetical protein